MRARLYNPFRPHIAIFPCGGASVRKLSILHGWMYFNVHHPRGNRWETTKRKGGIVYQQSIKAAREILWAHFDKPKREKAEYGRYLR